MPLLGRDARAECERIGAELTRVISSVATTMAAESENRSTGVDKSGGERDFRESEETDQSVIEDLSDLIQVRVSWSVRIGSY